MSAISKKLLRTLSGIIPLQYFNKTADRYEAAEGSDGAQHVKLTGSDIQQPVEVQSVFTEQEKTLTAASVGIGATVNFTAYPVNMAGYTELGFGCIASASHNYAINVLASPDGTTVIGDIVLSKSGTGTSKQGQVKSPLDYIVYQIINSDASARTYDVWTRKFN